MSIHSVLLRKRAWRGGEGCGPLSVSSSQPLEEQSVLDSPGHVELALDGSAVPCACLCSSCNWLRSAAQSIPGSVMRPVSESCVALRHWP